jgi:hypothetical protein
MNDNDKKRPKTKPKPEVEPTLDAPILNADGTHQSDTATLDTGMKVSEAVSQAALWWDNRGRRLIRDKNYASDNPGFGSFNPDPKSVEDADNWIPSGVMAGKPWADLSKVEKLQVTKHWHHNNIRVPNIDPELYLRATKRPGICFYCDEESVSDETLPNGENREMCLNHFMDRYPEQAMKVFKANQGGASNDN